MKVTRARCRIVFANRLIDGGDTHTPYKCIPSLRDVTLEKLSTHTTATKRKS